MGLDRKDLKEEYRLGKTLGKGTFGDVYLAECRANSKLVVAIKTLRDTGASSHSLPSGEYFESLREVIFFRNVTPHPNLIELYDMFQDSESHNVVFSLESMRGNMLQFIEYHRKKPKTPGIESIVVAKIAKDMLTGLDHIHKSGFVHRDIKPENVLWTGHGGHLVVKLADFGLSRAIVTASDRPWTGYVATRWYRSPEQLLDLKIHTPAVDIWATSLVLYEVCNLAPLFPGKTTTNMIEKQVEALGIPSRDSVGGSSIPVFNALCQHFGNSVRREAPTIKGFIITLDWFRWESHECFNDAMISGLQWDPERRPSAEDMLGQVREAVKKHHKDWILNGKPILKRTKSV